MKITQKFLPFLAIWWMNLESHCCCDEAVIFHVINIIHFEWTTVFNVSPASQFNSILSSTECECSVLLCNTGTEFAIKKLDFVVIWMCIQVWEVEDGQELELEKKIVKNQSKLSRWPQPIKSVNIWLSKSNVKNCQGWAPKISKLVHIIQFKLLHTKLISRIIKNSNFLISSSKQTCIMTTKKSGSMLLKFFIYEWI